MDLNQLLKTRQGFDLIISGRTAVNITKKLYEEDESEFVKKLKCIHTIKMMFNDENLIKLSLDDLRLFHNKLMYCTY